MSPIGVVVVVDTAAVAAAACYRWCCSILPFIKNGYDDDNVDNNDDVFFVCMKLVRLKLLVKFVGICTQMYVSVGAFYRQTVYWRAHTFCYNYRSLPTNSGSFVFSTSRSLCSVFPFSSFDLALCL